MWRTCRSSGCPVVVAINRFGTDTDAELQVVDNCCKELGVRYALSEVFSKGGEGGLDLARTICDVIDESEGKREFCPHLSHRGHGGGEDRRHRPEDLRRPECDLHRRGPEVSEGHQALGGDSLPVCIAKTQYSLSDNAKLPGPSHGLYHHHPGPAALQRRGLCGGLRRGHHDHARPAPRSPPPRRSTWTTTP